MSFGAPDAGFAPGALIAGRYEVERALGRGGMGVVHVARDRRLGRRVALKTIAAELAGKEGARERLRAEAQAVASVEHAGIVTLFDVVDHGDDVVLVMELVQGISLRERLAEGPLPVREVASIVSGVASALSAAHARGLVHRDVKPDNVMLRSDGRTALLDFGVAKALHSEGDVPRADSSLASTGVAVGTPAYFAPEQARGERVTPASDQFALAIVAFELLTGVSPWPLKNLAELMTALLLSDLAPASSRRVELGADVDRVLARATSKEEAARYPDVEAFAVELAAALGCPLSESPLQTSRRAQRGQPPTGPFAETLAEASSTPIHSPLALAKTELGTPRGSAVTMSSAPPRRSRRLLVAVVTTGFLAAGLAVLFGVRAQDAAPSAAAPSSSVAVLSSSDALRIADVPASSTKVPEALSSFRDAMRRNVRGDFRGAANSLDAAVKLDPDFASARLQRALLAMYWSSAVPDAARVDVAAARARSGELSPRDRELLEAIAPGASDPPDWKTLAERLRAFLDRRPNDTQGWDALGVALTKSGDHAGAIRAFETESARDPSGVAGYQIWSDLVREKGDDAGADRILDECMAREPTALGCRAKRTNRLAAEGRCAEMEAFARETTALAPDSPLAYASRAAAVAGQRAPIDAVVHLLEQHHARLASTRAETAHRDAAIVAYRQGDFTGALSALDAPGPDGPWQDSPDDALFRVTVLTEMGDDARAGSVAASWIRRAAALPLPDQPGDDQVANMLAPARRGRAITEAEYQSLLVARVEVWKRHYPPAELTTEGQWVSLALYSRPNGPDEARAFVAAASVFGGFPSRTSWPDPTELARIGDALRLAGRTEEAIPYLRESAGWCSLLPRPDAWLHLGEAEETLGHDAAACAAYAEALSYWAHAKPRSVTADEAKKRANKLGCPARSNAP